MRSISDHQPSILNKISSVATLALILLSPVANAEIDGHGPDAWRVTGVANNDELIAHMGPGADYPVIDHFAANERGLEQITCVPLLISATYLQLSETEREALPPRWCLMRSADLSKAGWVTQRFITPDHTAPEKCESPHESDDMVAAATSLVRSLYQAQARAERDQGDNPLFGDETARYFSADIVSHLSSGHLDAHPLYGAQDFEGEILCVAPDPDSPMFRGMITVNVDFTNFGQPQRAIFYLRSDTSRDDAAVRIFHIEHDGWDFP